MKNLLSLFAAVVLFGLFAVSAFADIPRMPEPTPKKGKEISSFLRIQVRSDITEARLVIPKNMSKQLRAELEGDDNPALASTQTSTQTIVGGLLLSVAFVFGGVWFVRSAKESNKSARAAGIFVILAASGVAATIAFANAAPPPLRSLNSDMLSDYAKRRGVEGEIKIEISNTENEIILQIPRKPENKSE